MNVDSEEEKDTKEVKEEKNAKKKEGKSQKKKLKFAVEKKVIISTKTKGNQKAVTTIEGLHLFGFITRFKFKRCC